MVALRFFGECGEHDGPWPRRNRWRRGPHVMAGNPGSATVHARAATAGRAYRLFAFQGFRIVVFEDILNHNRVFNTR